MTLQLIGVIRDPRTGKVHVRETVTKVREVRDNLGRQMMQVRFENGDTTLVFGNEVKEAA